MEINRDFDQINRTTLDENDPVCEEAELTARLFHAVKLNPEFAIGDLEGDALAWAALDGMAKYGHVDSSRCIENETHALFEKLCADGSHEALSIAVRMADEYLGYEELSEAWYAREELEVSIDRFNSANSSEDKTSMAMRMYRPEEFALALKMTKHGFEDATHVVARMVDARLYLALLNMTPVTYPDTNRRILINSLDTEELKNTGSLPRVRFAHEVIQSMVEKIRGTITGGELLNLADRLEIVGQEAVLDIALVSEAGDAKLLGAEVLPKLLERDPNSEKFKKARKKLARHFKWAQFVSFPSFSFNPYNVGDIETALHNLDEITITDATHILAEAAVRSTVEKEE